MCSGIRVHQRFPDRGVVFFLVWEALPREKFLAARRERGQASTINCSSGNARTRRSPRTYRICDTRHVPIGVQACLCAYLVVEQAIVARVRTRRMETHSHRNGNPFAWSNQTAEVEGNVNIFM